MPSSIIPAYNYPSPTTTWDAWISGAPVVRWMIGDPGDPGGPGVGVDTNYVAAFAHAASAGIGVLGYVDTNFGAVSSSTAEGQVDLWGSLYGVTSIFFDNVASGTSKLAYYQALGDYVHALGGTVMFNHGTNPNEAYYGGMADILCVFEGSQADFDAYVPASFLPKYPGNMTCVLVYSVTSLAASTANASRAYGFGAGYIYCTDDALPAPWDTAPTYWADEVAALADATGGGGRGG